ncbi:LOW QUALITY PROTEIN: armadillo repeat-containing protein 5 [Colossoma macropomum]|uniref:LOW QUALITY PROTEIN: armadillo repeat-containing protein 5 n=1 Tax=Colossoma macropomum TaxID=42526 RepID=UPI0018645FB2|nr:LOW QUALITY PROTEIN: armadillo repeat-containing protein 5 [Colossoma macropomum]
MAAQAGGERKHPKGTAGTKEASSVPLESSLSWCLAQLTKSNSSSGLTGADNKPISGRETSREADKRLKAGQWRALVAIRTQHVKGGRSRIVHYQAKGGLPPLLDILRRPESSRKVLDLALSILANCCTEKETRAEVRKLDGISVVVEVLKRHASEETVENRAARALGNLAMDPEGSAQVHAAGGVPPLLLCLALSNPPSCTSPSSPSSSSPSSPLPSPRLLCLPLPKLERAQSAARALLYLSDTPANRLSLLSQGAVPALALFIAPEYPPGLRRASLRALHELTRGCGTECAREVSMSGALAQLGLLASGEEEKPLEELALKTLANLCSQGCLRPLVGSLGVIQKFAEEVKKDPLRSGVFFKALCLCCKEAVNRAKVKESGGLEVLIGFLAAHPNHPLTRLAVLACVDFVYDESALEQLQDLGLVPLLVARLVELSKGEELSLGKLDASLSSGSNSELMTSCFDSFDFPAPEGSRREEMGKEQGPGSSSFLSLRSWLVSEGLISSEGELMESPCGTDGDSVTSHPSCSPSSTSSLTPLSDAPSPAPSLPKPISSPRPKPCRLSASASPQSALNKTSPNSPPTLLPTCTSTPQPKPPAAPISPPKVSSPPRKRPRTSSSSSSSSSTTSCSSLLSLEAPPVMPKTPVYQHPYHPEPWAPESPILLLLSRFSHATDPSGVLINAPVISGLLYYLTHHHDPSGRCLRMLGRLSCNPNCLQALIRTGAVALIRHRLCLREVKRERDGKRNDRQSDRVKAKIRQLGQGLLSNVRVQSETGFGSGVLSHIVLSGSESDKLYCVLSLPLLTSNRVLLKKLLLDSGGLTFALEPLCCMDGGDDESDHSDKCRTFLSAWMCPPEQVSVSKLHSLYVSLLIGCLSSILAYSKVELERRKTAVEAPQSPIKNPLIVEKESNRCPQNWRPVPYEASAHNLSFLLDDGTLLTANREAVAGDESMEEVGSEYFRALLRGGFGEASKSDSIPIKDVSRGMLLPVLHYLHGCRMTSVGHGMDEEAGRCLVLTSLVFGGLKGHKAFQKSPLAEVMVGASRFLVPGLQKAAEDSCVSLLSSAASSVPGLPCKTSDLAKKTKLGLGSVCRESKTAADGQPSEQRAKCSRQHCKLLEESSVDEGTEFGSLQSLLPQAYSFSQRFSYSRLSRACLLTLLQPQEAQNTPLPPSLSADCLLRLAREADSTESLRQDLLKLATAALS